MKSRLLSVLLTGFALALGLLIAVQIAQSFGNNEAKAVSQKTPTRQDENKTVKPVRFETILEQDGNLQISGTSEPNAVVIIQNSGENFRQLKSNDEGRWTSVIELAADQPLSLGLQSYIEGDIRVKSEEVLLRIPAPPSLPGQTAPDQSAQQPSAPSQSAPVASAPQALIIVTAPGGPTRVIKSPFDGGQDTGPLSMGPIDYDERGSVIFSGRSRVAGDVKIFAKGKLIGQRPVEQNGRWFFIAAETLPRGKYEIEAKLTTADGTQTSLVVLFNRLTLRAQTEPSQTGVTVNFGANIWQISWPLEGGGRQFTAITKPAMINIKPE